MKCIFLSDSSSCLLQAWGTWRWTLWTSLSINSHGQLNCYSGRSCTLVVFCYPNIFLHQPTTQRWLSVKSVNCSWKGPQIRSNWKWLPSSSLGVRSAGLFVSLSTFLLRCSRFSEERGAVCYGRIHCVSLHEYCCYIYSTHFKWRLLISAFNFKLNFQSQICVLLEYIKNNNNNPQQSYSNGKWSGQVPEIIPESYQNFWSSIFMCSAGYTTVVTDRSSDYRLFDTKLIIVSLSASTEGLYLQKINIRARF